MVVKVTFPKKSVIDIFRQYTHMYRIPKRALSVVPDLWIKGYQIDGIDLTKSAQGKPKLWWDAAVRKYIDLHGKDYFKDIDLPENSNVLLSYLRFTKTKKMRLLDRLIKLILR